MRDLPNGFSACLADIHRHLENVDGWLNHKEVEFLALAAACPTAGGEILEIGSYRGRSTIVLAKAAALTDSPRVVAVDPMLEPAGTSAGRSHPSGRAVFEANLTRAGVREQIDFHQTYSGELGQTWDRPLRLLFIDGDHSYEGAKLDFDSFAPFLSDGAIIAFHDVLHWRECIRVYIEEVLHSDRFGAAGVCGSIGWAQHWKDPARCALFREERLALAHRMTPLVPFQRRRGKPPWLAKMSYKLLRARVPHGPVDPRRWLDRVA